MEFDGYCVNIKCRTKRHIKDGRVEKTAKGRFIAKGRCPVCGTTVTRFLSNKEIKIAAPREPHLSQASPHRNVNHIQL